MVIFLYCYSSWRSFRSDWKAGHKNCSNSLLQQSTIISLHSQLENADRDVISDEWSNLWN